MMVAYSATAHIHTLSVKKCLISQKMFAVMFCSHRKMVFYPEFLFLMKTDGVYCQEKRQIDSEHIISPQYLSQVKQQKNNYSNQAI